MRVTVRSLLAVGTIVIVLGLGVYTAARTLKPTRDVQPTPTPTPTYEPSPTPDIAAQLRAEADSYLQAEDWPQATSALTRLVEADPYDTDALYRLALLVASYDPQAARTYLTRAAVDASLAAPANAVRAELDALADEPDRAYANTRLALVLMAQEEWAMAELALARAVLLEPGYAEALAYLGLTRAYQGKDGLPQAQEAVEMAPDSALVRYTLGRLYVVRGEDYRAIPTLRQAAALDPEHAMVAAELGTAYRRRGELEDAAYWLRRSVELDRDNVRFWETLATFYADTLYDLEGDALTLINSAAVRAPGSADIRASLGWALYHAGETEAARGEIEAAFALDPSNARALYYRAVMLEAGGDVAGAVEAYLNVMQTAPESAFVQMAGRALNRIRGE